MTLKKSQNPTPENSEEMARQGAKSFFGYLTPTAKDLNGPRGCIFGKIARNDLLSGIFEVFHKISLKCAKMGFKVPLEHGLKVNPDFGKKSVTFHPDFSENGGF